MAEGDGSVVGGDGGSVSRACVHRWSGERFQSWLLQTVVRGGTGRRPRLALLLSVCPWAAMATVVDRGGGNQKRCPRPQDRGGV